MLYGDVNADGEVDGRDILRLTTYISSGDGLTEQGLKNADVNADGKVDKTDLMALILFRSYVVKGIILSTKALSFARLISHGIKIEFPVLEIIKIASFMWPEKYLTFASAAETLTK